MMMIDYSLSLTHQCAGAMIMVMIMVSIHYSMARMIVIILYSMDDSLCSRHTPGPGVSQARVLCFVLIRFVSARLVWSARTSLS